MPHFNGLPTLPTSRFSMAFRLASSAVDDLRAHFGFPKSVGTRVHGIAQHAEDAVIDRQLPNDLAAPPVLSQARQQHLLTSEPQQHLACTAEFIHLPKKQDVPLAAPDDPGRSRLSRPGSNKSPPAGETVALLILPSVGRPRGSAAAASSTRTHSLSPSIQEADDR